LGVIAEQYSVEAASERPKKAHGEAIHWVESLSLTKDFPRLRKKFRRNTRTADSGGAGVRVELAVFTCGLICPERRDLNAALGTHIAFESYGKNIYRPRGSAADTIKEIVGCDL
jgi:hypothetical protein